jgi:hypothetical protein
VFVALLRAVQPDAKRPLVREALDILTPALPTRLAPGLPCACLKSRLSTSESSVSFASIPVIDLQAASMC